MVPASHMGLPSPNRKLEGGWRRPEIARVESSCRSMTGRMIAVNADTGPACLGFTAVISVIPGLCADLERICALSGSGPEAFCGLPSLAPPSGDGQAPPAWPAHAKRYEVDE